MATALQKIIAHHRSTTVKLIPLLQSSSQQPIQQRRNNSDECKGGNKGLLLGVYQEESCGEPPRLTTNAEKYNLRLQGKISELIREYGMTGHLGTGNVFNNIDPLFRAVSVVGLGREGIGYNELEALDEGMENVRIAAALGAKQLQKDGCSTVLVDPMEYIEQAAEGCSMAVWLHQENKALEKRIVVPKLELFESPEADEFTRGLIKGESQNLARRLSDSPANQMTPTDFAQAAVDALCPCGITVEVRNMDWIVSQNMNSFLSVARSSCEPPVFLEISYCGGDPDILPVLFVGSGLTFNSGGLHLKHKDGFAEQRATMGGAAAVVATMQAVAQLSLPINVAAVIPLCENMPSGMAFKPGDVITCLNGKTIGVHDCSQADVLIMADTFCYGMTSFKPRLVVDVATLTKGVQRGLGGACSGVFSNSHYMWKQMHRAGAISGDRVWRLPLWKHFTKKVTGFANVDVSNKGKGTGQTCLAAAFLKEFCPCTDWIHMDIYNVGMNICSPSFEYLVPGRMTGRPTRTLIQFLYQLCCPEAAMKQFD